MKNQEMEFGRNRERLQFFKVCLCTCRLCGLGFIKESFIYQYSGLDYKLNVIIWKCQVLKSELITRTENWLSNLKKFTLIWFLSVEIYEALVFLMPFMSSVP